MNLIGLTQFEVEKRLREFGENKLKKQKDFTSVKVFLSQFKSPLIYVLVIACGVTWWLGDLVNAGIIGAAVVLNTFLGFFQEMKAEKGVKALSRMLTPKAKVVREGISLIVEASQIVPGDVCILEIGERVPADGEIIEFDSLSLDEAILTGESRAVKKKLKDEVFMGTTVVSGIAKMLIKKTGQQTAVGKISQSLGETKKSSSPLQQQLDGLAKKLAVMVGIICLIIFAIGLLRGNSFIEIFTTSVAVAVSAIPEGLVIALTVILSIGMQRIFKRKALVRKLIAAETLGSVTVICCDKTGTLTEGKMTVVKALTDNEPLLRQAAVLCNDERDPLETAMMVWGREKYNDEAKRLDERPFNHKDKYIVTLHPGLMLVSGAPEVLLKKSRLTIKESQEWLKRFETEAKLGQRLVGFGYKKTSAEKIDEKEVKDLIWLGVLIYDDPVRVGVKEALADARLAGIKVKLITGDYQATAEAVAEQLGILPQDVYSRTTPEQKLKIVEELQEQGEVVAMTGDGVNDAPALKKADIGIVVAGASAVAQETADMVLMDSKFATILAAVEEGRGIYVNLKKIVFYLMSHVFTEIVLVMLSLIFKLPLALTAGQILWINLVNDSWPSFSLTLEPKTNGLASLKIVRKPELLDKKMKQLIVVISGFTGITALGLFYSYFTIFQDINLARSMAFCWVGIAPLWGSFSIRTFDKSVFKEKLWANPWLVVGVGLGMASMAAGLYIPQLQLILKTTALNWSEWRLIAGLTVILIGLIEAVKWRFNRKI
ncbi:MAG: HAD-IC family P-type ATPase [Candidatus Beckwithbacteria bacterium]